MRASYCRNVRDDIEQEDTIESYLRFMEENPNIGVVGDEEEIYEYDEEGNIVSVEKKVRLLVYFFVFSSRTINFHVSMLGH